MRSLEDMQQVAQEILPLIEDHRIVLLKGDLGSGKTTLTQHLCQGLDLDLLMSSPTYSIINEYEISSCNIENVRKIYHIDLYRLSDLEEAIQIGIEDYLDNEQALCFVEWPELIESLLEKALLIEIKHNKNESRQIIIYLYNGLV